MNQANESFMNRRIYRVDSSFERQDKTKIHKIFRMRRCFNCFRSFLFLEVRRLTVPAVTVLNKRAIKIDLCNLYWLHFILIECCGRKSYLNSANIVSFRHVRRWMLLPIEWYIICYREFCKNYINYFYHLGNREDRYTYMCVFDMRAHLRDRMSKLGAIKQSG